MTKFPSLSAIVLAVPLPIAGRGADDTVHIFLAPTPCGDDANEGDTEESPVHTLSRALELCKMRVPNRDKHVLIKVSPGVYRGQSVVWDYYSRTHKTTILGSDNGLPDTVEGMPQFLGPPSSDPRANWFVGPKTLTYETQEIGGGTNLEIRGICVNRYRTAIRLVGSDGNRISGCYFRNVGVLTGTSDSSFGTILAWSSSHNRIENSFFRINGNFEGDRPTLKQFHAIYCLYHSSNNVIRGNNFSRISGPAVKLKDASNHNVIEGNRFSGIIVGAAIQDHYKRSSQAPSWMNRFKNNTVRPNHSGRTPVYGIEIQYPVFDDRIAERLFQRVIVSGNSGNPKANTIQYWMHDNTSYDVEGQD